MTMFLLCVAISALLIGSLIGELTVPSSRTCRDIDDIVCQQLNESISGFCNDPCFRRLCPEMCQHCPLECFDCIIDMRFNDRICNTTTVCPTAEHKCYLARNLLTHEMGCGSSEAGDVCGYGGWFGPMEFSTPGFCCETNLCNEDNGTIPLTLKSTTPVSKTTVPSTMSMGVSLDTCMDVNDTACARLSAIQPDVCKYSCVSEACPRMCGKCINCYRCENIPTSEVCNQTEQCNLNEVCYAEKLLDADGRISYRQGCLKKKTCSIFQRQASSIFGKRSSEHKLVVNGNCCDQDYCNNMTLTHAAGNTHHISTTSSITATDTTLSTVQPLSNKINATDCHDNPKINCHLYDVKKICQTQVYIPWAKKNCPAYCGFCTIAVPTITIPCVDRLPNCNEYGDDLCSNPTYRLFREDNCRKYCGICKGVDHVTATPGTTTVSSSTHHVLK